ncbi:MAG: glycosyltransferase [Polyangiales bacterium]
MTVAPQRIAIVSEGFHPEVSGVTIAVARHLAFFAARGHELLLAHPRYPDAVAALFRAGPAPAVPATCVRFDSEPIAPHRPESRVPTERGADEVDDAIASFRPRVVLYHNADRVTVNLARPWRPSRVAGLRAARALGAHAVPIVHTLLPLYVERSAQWYWRLPPVAAFARRLWCDVHNRNFPFAVTVDHAARDYVRAAGVTIPVLAGPWNGVDTATFHPRDLPRAPDAPLRIASVGRLVHEKRAELLIPLVASLRRAGVRFHLTVVGDGALAPSLRAALDGASDVTFTGWRAPPDVAEALAHADLYLSLSDTESFSLTAEEALASGVPVVAPDVIGFRRLAGGELGRLFPAAWLDARGMDALARLLRDEATSAQREAWARNARATAASRGWDVALGSFAEALSRETGVAL